MWRTDAILTDLAGDVAGLRLPADRTRPELFSALSDAVRRAKRVVALDWLAIVVLLASREPAGRLLETSASIDLVFALGVLAVAVHSGFRLGQIEKLRAVERLAGELDQRDPSAD